MTRKTPSDEVDHRQLRLARNEGDAYHASLQYMIEQVAHTGGTQQVKDMIIGFAQEPAEGLYLMNAEETLEWTEPGEENCHLEVTVLDAEDHRFVPYCDVSVSLFDANDVEHGPFDIPFIWHPGLHHYGRNITLPSDGTYDLHIHVDAPAFNRHDKENGKRYTTPVEVVFENVDITTGQD